MAEDKKKTTTTTGTEDSSVDYTKKTDPGTLAYYDALLKSLDEQEKSQRSGSLAKTAVLGSAGLSNLASLYGPGITDIYEPVKSVSARSASIQEPNVFDPGMQKLERQLNDSIEFARKSGRPELIGGLMAQYNQATIELAGQQEAGGLEARTQESLANLEAGTQADALNAQIDTANQQMLADLTLTESEQESKRMTNIFDAAGKMVESNKETSDALGQIDVERAYYEALKQKKLDLDAFNQEKADLIKFKQGLSAENAVTGMREDIETDIDAIDADILDMDLELTDDVADVRDATINQIENSAMLNALAERDIPEIDESADVTEADLTRVLDDMDAYTVKAGDTVSAIAKQRLEERGGAYTDADVTAETLRIVDENNINHNKLSIGQELRLPHMGGKPFVPREKGITPTITDAQIEAEVENDSIVPTIVPDQPAVQPQSTEEVETPLYPAGLDLNPAATITATANMPDLPSLNTDQEKQLGLIFGNYSDIPVTMANQVDEDGKITSYGLAHYLSPSAIQDLINGRDFSTEPPVASDFRVKRQGISGGEGYEVYFMDELYEKRFKDMYGQVPIFDDLLSDEGIRSGAYFDSRRYLTQGIGIKIPSEGMEEGREKDIWSYDEITTSFDEAYKSHTENIGAKMEEFDISIERHGQAARDFARAISNVNYQQGPEWLKAWKYTNRDIAAKRYDEAIKRVEQSPWMLTQTPKRAFALIRALEAIKKAEKDAQEKDRQSLNRPIVKKDELD